MGPYVQYILQQMIMFIGITGLPNEWVQNLPQWHKNYFELNTSDYQQMQEEALSKVPILPKNRSSPKKELNCPKFPPLEFYSPGKIASYHRKGKKALYPDRCGHKYIIALIYFPKDSFIFPKCH